jgi:hypothetical protein
MRLKSLDEQSTSKTGREMYKPAFFCSVSGAFQSTIIKSREREGWDGGGGSGESGVNEGLEGYTYRNHRQLGINLR